MPYRNNYMNDHTSDEESTESLGSYMNNVRETRTNDRHEDSVGRSLRSSRQSLKSSSHPIDDDDNDQSNRRRYRQNLRERRASSISSKADRQRLKSDTTQDSEAESGTRALVQAKIREKVAQASSMDESSSDLWRPKKNGQVKQSTKERSKTQATNEKNRGEKMPTKEVEEKKTSNKATENICRIAKNTRPKVSTQVQTTPPRENSIEKRTVQPIINIATNRAEPRAEEHKSDDNEDVPDMGPAPSTPNYEWECEFCTFTNEPNTKICSICCKTPTRVAIRKASPPSSDDTKPSINGQLNEHAEISREGKPIRSIRKISFSSGTKS